jgi:hypothetical protein
LLQRGSRHKEAAECWRQYLANDAQSEWAARARRSLKFCEMRWLAVAASAEVCGVRMPVAASVAAHGHPWLAVVAFVAGQRRGRLAAVDR